MRGITIAVFAPAFRKHEFFLRFQHREPTDFFKIPGEARFKDKGWSGGSLSHLSHGGLL
ncbi:MAG: hypothetical protein ABSE50_18095 [Xanthobacteraceae bacterium]